MKNLTCIICPIGCSLCVTEENGTITVSGNTCKRGEEYAKAEITNPVRTLTTSVKTDKDEIISVKSASPIPKAMLLDAVKELTKVTITSPVKSGDVVYSNLLGTGIDIIATKSSI